MKRIIYFRTDMLGDTLLNLPVVDAIKRLRPDSHVTFVCHPALEELLKRFPAIDESIGFDAGRRRARFKECLALFQTVKAGGYDVAIVSNARKDLHLIAFLAGIKKRIGYGRKWGLFLTDRLEDRKYEGGRHEIEYNMDLLRPLGLTVDHPVFHLSEDVGDDAECHRVLAEEKIVGGQPLVLIHPFSSNPSKCWSKTKFFGLMTRLTTEAKCQVALIGSADEVTGARELLKLTGDSVKNLTGKTSLRGLCSVIGKARLVVGIDSGPMHLAAGLGTPTVTLFGIFPGSADPKRWRPWGEGHAVIHEKLDHLDVETVWTEVRRKLMDSPRDSTRPVRIWNR